MTKIILVYDDYGRSPRCYIGPFADQEAADKFCDDHGDTDLRHVHLVVEDLEDPSVYEKDTFEETNK